MDWVSFCLESGVSAKGEETKDEAEAIENQDFSSSNRLTG